MERANDEVPSSASLVCFSLILMYRFTSLIRRRLVCSRCLGVNFVESHSTNSSVEVRREGASFSNYIVETGE